MNHKLANSMKIRKGKENTTTLLFSLIGLEIVHQKRRGKVKTMVMEDFNHILFYKYGPAIIREVLEEPLEDYYQENPKRNWRTFTKKFLK